MDSGSTVTIAGTARRTIGRRGVTAVMVSTAGRLRAPAILSLPGSLSGAGRIVAASPHSAHRTPTAGSPGQVAASIIASGSYSVHST
jgi:hypothetical protein